MIIVSNTSPLTNLAAIGEFDLLESLYGHLHIAQGVWDELNAKGQRWPGRDEVATADWIEKHTIENRTLVTALRRDLDLGEAESIALALEIGADFVVLDEYGRTSCRTTAGVTRYWRRRHPSGSQGKGLDNNDTPSTGFAAPGCGILSEQPGVQTRIISG